jgi:arylsulfatase A-like enzyme
MEDHWNVPAYHFDPKGEYRAARPVVRDPYHNNTLEQRPCDHIHAGYHSTDLFVDTALRFLEAQKGSKPFFMYVSLMAPHDPRSMPEKFLQMYDPAAIELPPNFLAQHPFDTGDLRGRDELLADIPRQPDEIRRHLAEYYAMISHLDDAFGRLMDGLKKSGQFENTFIVFAGDNGLALGQHGLMGKQNLYDHSVRVPLVFAGPGIPAGQHSRALVYLHDIFPTLCALAGLETPASVEGRSLLPNLHIPALTARDQLYLAYASHIRGVSDGKYKLIEYAGGACQLFNLVSDPWEMHNLATDPANRDLLAALRRSLRRLAVDWEDEKHPTGQVFWRARRDLA